MIAYTYNLEYEKCCCWNDCQVERMSARARTHTLSIFLFLSSKKILMRREKDRILRNYECVCVCVWQSLMSENTRKIESEQKNTVSMKRPYDHARIHWIYRLLVNKSHSYEHFWGAFNSLTKLQDNLWILISTQPISKLVLSMQLRNYHMILVCYCHLKF